MNTESLKKLLISAVLVLFTSSLLASAETDFEKGVTAFKSGDNAAAASYFEQALQQGMDTVALRYNLASSYYKLGRYEDAKKYFKIVNQTVAMRDLAEFNLGLIAIKQKKWSLARRYFNSIKTSGKDEKLIRLSKQQLVLLQKKEDTWKTYVSASVGHDDNISSASSDSVSGVSDTFYDLYASADYLLTGRRKDGWVADAYVYRIDFRDTDSYDENHYSAGIKRAFIFDDWETSAQFSLLKSTFGDDDYLSSGKLDFRVRKPISKNERVYLRYRYEDINSDKSIYDYLEGSRQRARVEYRQYNPSNFKQLYYELESNNRGQLVTSSYAYDYSPVRHTLRGKYTQYLDDQWSLSADLSYRQSDYPISASFDRDDDRWQLALSAGYRFDRTFKLTTRLQFTDNASTVDRYEYDKAVFKIGLSKAF